MGRPYTWTIDGTRRTAPSSAPSLLGREEIFSSFSIGVLATAVLWSLALIPVTDSRPYPAGGPEANVFESFYRQAKSLVTGPKEYLKEEVAKPVLREAVDRMFVPKIREYLQTHGLTSVHLKDYMDINKLSPIPGVGVTDVEISGIDSVQRHGDVDVEVHSVAPVVDAETEGRFRFQRLMVKVLLGGTRTGATKVAKIAGAVFPKLNLDFVLAVTVRVKAAVTLTPSQLASLVFNRESAFAKIDKNRIRWKEVEVEDVEILPGGDLSEEKIPLFASDLRARVEETIRQHIVHKVISNNNP